MKRNQPKQERRTVPLNRRGFLQGASVAAASLALPRVARAQSSGVPQIGIPLRGTLVYCFLRGGADGLSMSVPYSDPVYTDPLVRPTIAVPPGSYTALDGTWALPDALSPLLTAWGNNDLAVIPASGVLEKNRSHFIQMDKIEFGTPPPPEMPPANIVDGFMARHLSNASFPTTPVLRGIVMQKLATKSFIQAPLTLAIKNVEDFDFPGENLMGAATQVLHATQSPPLSTASENAFNAIDYLNNVNYANTVGNYPPTEFGDQFQRAASLILDGNPPEILEIDLGSWDHHNQQDPVNPGGLMWDIMDDFARSLSAFYTDMAALNPYTNRPWNKSVTVVVVSEFGRRVQENSSQGTDHGWGSTMFALGGRVNGGVVYDNGWSGLVNETDTDGDVRVLTDHRDVFSEALSKLMRLGNPQDVYFSNYNFTDYGIFS